MVYKIKSTKKKSKKPLFNLVLLLLVVGAFILVRNTTNKSAESVAEPSDQSTSQDTINYNPPTQEEAQSGDEKKQNIPSKDQSDSVVQNTAQIVIVDANQYDNEIEVRAFVSNIIQDGKCIITFRKDSTNFNKEVPVYADASSTPCVALTVASNEFNSPGTWSVEVQYSNGSVTGSSVTEMEIR